jgi:guanine deaminase
MAQKSDNKFMRRAIAMGRRGVRKGQTPFAACIVLNGKVIGLNHNHVWKNCDITAHGEIMTIRQACKKTKKIDFSGATIYSTCEPCPMCFSAIHWARISRIVYGAKISDAKKAGFNELRVSNHQLKKMGKSQVKIQGGVLRKENVALFKEWIRLHGDKKY